MNFSFKKKTFFKLLKIQIYSQQNNFYKSMKVLLIRKYKIVLNTSYDNYMDISKAEIEIKEIDCLFSTELADIEAPFPS